MPINTPTITIVDSANGTGAVLTIAGATALTTNDVYTSDDGGDSWALEGTRSGNGTVTLTLADGRHWAYVDSSLAGEFARSLVRGFRTTDGTLSVSSQILAAVQATVQSLNLADIDPSDVRVQKLPWNRPEPTPYLPTVILYPLPETQQPGTNNRDGYGYGVGLVAMQKSNHDLTANLDRLTMWRQLLNRAFRSGRSQLSSITELTGQMDIEPGSVIVPDAFTKQYDVTALTLRIYTREVRGVA